MTQAGKTPTRWLFIIALILWSGVGTTINDFFLPGSQPLESGNLEQPGKCDNCHGGYNNNTEPTYNWKGGMMAQAARDPLYLACLAIANQDAPGSGDLCIRCHAPDGWLHERSEPTDGSALTLNDKEGVQCDFCHRLVKPSPLGSNPFPNDINYTFDTYSADQEYLNSITLIPPQSGNGMYVVHSNNAKRGPYLNAPAKHQIKYSPFHQESDICGTCHDVSNPVYSKNDDGSYAPNEMNKMANHFSTYMMLPVERTYSEWKMSAFNTKEGIYSGVFGGNKQNVSTCQDCHMKDISGYGSNKSNTPYRNDLPLHDLTGGNTFIPKLIHQTHPNETDLGTLTAAGNRANFMLQNAAKLSLELNEFENSICATVIVTNQTGHKLPSGYPEGRRIWINLKAFDIDETLLYESGAYDTETAVLNQNNSKIYEIKMGLSEAIASTLSTPQKTYIPGESFHFVLNDTVLKDNRIPPQGFTNENFNAIQSPVVNYSYKNLQHWDTTKYTLPKLTHKVEVRLYYQTVSKEYVEFLRDENRTNNAGQLFYDLWSNNGKSAPVLMAKSEAYHIATNLVDKISEPYAMILAPNPSNGPAIFTRTFN